ncbi:GyrI-like domain-containing protein [Rossellomorea aquimaris]|uniref:GyrI-like domain-containing protein n=1 Tax=Rossellomorea aquimaris TaxID=189382 RepID=UPI0007D0B25E|nr:GyrI-like domain-containing protein [Rossellomorea aquimaris]
MDITIKTLEDKLLVGMAWTGPYGRGSEIPLLFARFQEMIPTIQHLSGDACILAPFHDRATDFTYYCTVEVDRVEHLHPDLVELSLPAGEYAHSLYDGNSSEVEQAYFSIFNWIKENGYEKDYSRLSVEKYLEQDREINQTQEKRKLELFVPIKKKS